MDGVRSVPRIASTVRALTPDVVCFQELDRKAARSGRENQPEIIASNLACSFHFQSNLRLGLGQYGIGIASRAALRYRQEHFLPSGKEQRGALEVHLKDAGGIAHLTVFCTHWGLNQEERLEQARALALIVRDCPRPVVVCGDLNESADSPGVQHLLSEAGLLDADALQNRPTFDADNPAIRIDYCLYSEDLVLRHVEVISTYASDHLPVLADFEKV